MKYKYATNDQGWIYKIEDDGSKSASFANKGEIGKQMWIEYQKWLSKGNTTEPQYTAEEQAELDAQLAEKAKTQYQRDRQGEYPTIRECVHAILDDELEELQIKRQEVKEKYPKPTGG